MNKLDLKNPRNAYAVMVVMVVLAGLYFGYDMFWVPNADETQRLEAELKDSQAKLDKINIQKKRVSRLEKDLASAEKEFERLKEMFPEEEKVPLRLQDLYAVIRSSGVQIIKFNPEGRTEQEYYVENKYSLSVNAGYHMLGNLFAEVANFTYPTSIKDLRIGRYAGIDAEIKKATMHGWIPITTSVSFNLTTFTSRNLSK
jgi:type IV pilus assembly protein PilO